MFAKSQIELFVISYLKRLRNTNKFRSEKVFLEKSIAIIDWFLGVPCCGDPTGSVEFSHRDNTLTRFLSQQLTTDRDRRSLRKSLERTRELIGDILVDPCCNLPLLPITFNNITGADWNLFKIQVYDIGGVVLIAESDSVANQADQILNIAAGDYIFKLISTQAFADLFLGVDYWFSLSEVPFVDIPLLPLPIPANTPGTETSGIVTLVSEYTIQAEGST